MDMQSGYYQNRISCVGDLNRQAIANGWPLLCDSDCRFTEKKLSGVLALWREKAVDGIPYRKDMTARLLQPYIPQLSIFERVATADGLGRFRVRLMGTNMVMFTTEMSGRFVDEAIEAEFLPRWNALGQAVLHCGGPVRILHRGDTFHKKHVVGEAFAAPLLTNDGRADLIMAVTSFEGFDSWEVVSSQARLQLGL
jgi:hypothetical protein